MLYFVILLVCLIPFFPVFLYGLDPKAQYRRFFVWFLLLFGLAGVGTFLGGLHVLGVIEAPIVGQARLLRGDGNVLGCLRHQESARVARALREVRDRKAQGPGRRIGLTTRPARLTSSGFGLLA